MNWFFASSDAPFFFDDQLRRLSLSPDTWSNVSGFGQSTVPRLWIDYPFQLISTIFAHLGLSWFVIDKLWWIGIVVIALYSTYSLGMYWFKQKNSALLFSFLYILNTYSLLIFDGGQIGIALGIALVPLVIAKSIQFFQSTTFKKTLWFGLLLSLLLASDLRVFYMAAFLIGGVALYLLGKKKIVFHISWIFIPCIIFLTHSYWLLPLVFYPSLLVSYQSTGNSMDALRFYSVADFSHAFSLLHPNWPENIFGKVYFFRAEFLLLPLISFSFFLHKKIKRSALFLMLIGIFGAFLAKGVHDPFGGIYAFLYQYLPGFSLFRDPTKWYMYVVFSYALLFSYSVSLVKNKKLKLIGVLVWIVLLLPIFQHKMKGNLTAPILNPSDVALHQYLEKELFFRVLWLPTFDTFGHKSENQPAIIATDIFLESSPAGILRELQRPQTLSTIQTSGIKYIIVPPDHDKKIFLKDYLYDSQERDNLVQGLNLLPDFRRIPMQDYAVYEVPNPSPVFSSESWEIVSTEKGINTYSLAHPHFTQTIEVLWNYDPHWVLSNGTVSVPPEKTERGFMKFALPELFGENSQLSYLPQGLAEKSAVVSIISMSIFLLIGLFKRN